MTTPIETAMQLWRQRRVVEAEQLLMRELQAHGPARPRQRALGGGAVRSGEPADQHENLNREPTEEDLERLNGVLRSTYDEFRRRLADRR